MKLDRGGTLRVAVTTKMLPPEISTDRGQDSRILAVALELVEKAKSAKDKEKVVFITKDTNLRIRADAIRNPLRSLFGPLQRVAFLGTRRTSPLCTGAAHRTALPRIARRAGDKFRSNIAPLR